MICLAQSTHFLLLFTCRGRVSSLEELSVAVLCLARILVLSNAFRAYSYNLRTFSRVGAKGPVVQRRTYARLIFCRSRLGELLRNVDERLLGLRKCRSSSRKWLMKANCAEDAFGSASRARRMSAGFCESHRRRLRCQ
ncbi:hypothetical protein DFP72DRAFT_918349 [Ephemerocybe angulata]|uniref:Uncharacterized protein n=1 Tax=Ephemerocybe angulata TaxID=980116 RepID=A0A8H6HIT1_9AGAR|nr:hypothetical protein DFP72DRAFT_918349 [Tulosesus angulatus]